MGEVNFKNLNIREAGKKLSLPCETVSRAYLMFHQFHHSIDEAEHDEAKHNLIGAAVLFLSAKHDGKDCDIVDVIKIYYGMENNGQIPTDEEIKTIKASLTNMICFVARILESYIHHKVAHKYLFQFLLNIIRYVPSQQRDYVPITCMKFLTDFYTSKKCINHLAEHIAVACIDLSLRCLNLRLFESASFVHPLAWQKACCSDITQEKLYDIIEDILSIYQDE